jgi:hypothetical protein
MVVPTLDTLEVVKELKAAGFSDEQAEAVTRVVRRAQDIDLSDLATKADLAAVKADLNGKIDSLESRVYAKIDSLGSRIDTKIEALRADLIKWVFGVIGFQTLIIVGAIIALTKALVH